MKNGLIIFFFISSSFIQYNSKQLCIDDNFSPTVNESSSICCADYDQKEGWHILTIETSRLNKYTNSMKMLSAGFIEGYIYHEYIDYHYENIFRTIFKNTPLKEETKDFMRSSLQYAKDLCNSFNNKGFLKFLTNQEDQEFQETLCLILEQFKGLYLGYRYASNHKPSLKEEDFYTITMQADLEDLIPAFESERLSTGLFRREKDCSGFVKIVKNGELIVGHNTHNLYTLMNRVYKYYNFNITLSTGKQLNNIKFSSRPGDLNSKDDYYQLSNNMVVLETSLEVKNLEVYKNLSKNTLPKWIRVNLANRLCNDNESWINIFFQHNSGTHNNQWLITDFKAYENFKNLENTHVNGIVHIVEQTPIISNKYFEDISQRLISESYVASYNAPYFEEVALTLGITKEADYEHARRKFLFNQLHGEVKEIQGAQRLMRFHSEQDICDTIAPRCDLVEGRPFGAVDAKLTDSNLMKNMTSMIIYGPPFIEGLTQPFDFSQYEEYSHLGIPERFEYKWITA
jgi:hypothetical protein